MLALERGIGMVLLYLLYELYRLAQNPKDRVKRFGCILANARRLPAAGLKSMRIYRRDYTPVIILP